MEQTAFSKLRVFTTMAKIHLLACVLLGALLASPSLSSEVDPCAKLLKKKCQVQILCKWNTKKAGKKKCERKPEFSPSDCPSNEAASETVATLEKALKLVAALSNVTSESAENEQVRDELPYINCDEAIQRTGIAEYKTRYTWQKLTSKNTWSDFIVNSNYFVECPPISWNIGFQGYHHIKSNNRHEAVVAACNANPFGRYSRPGAEESLPQGSHYAHYGCYPETHRSLVPEDAVYFSVTFDDATNTSSLTKEGHLQWKTDVSSVWKPKDCKCSPVPKCHEVQENEIYKNMKFNIDCSLYSQRRHFHILRDKSWHDLQRWKKMFGWDANHPMFRNCACTPLHFKNKHAAIEDTKEALDQWWERESIKMSSTGNQDASFAGVLNKWWNDWAHTHQPTRSPTSFPTNYPTTAEPTTYSPT